MTPETLRKTPLRDGPGVASPISARRSTALRNQLGRQRRSFARAAGRGAGAARAGHSHPQGDARAAPRSKEGTGGQGRNRTWWYALGAIAAVVVGVGVAIVLTRGDKANAAKAAVVTTTPPGRTGRHLPLTGAPAPGGVVPARPALGVKIGNYTGDRPSAGLNQADIVFEEPVEGAITRLLAVFQCQGSSLVGDLRSAREPDVGILSQLSDPLFVHAGGIDPVIALLDSSPLIDENLYSGNHGSAIIYQPGREAPYSTFVNTASLWAFDPTDNTPPAPIFHYSAALPDHGGSRLGGQRAHSVLVDLGRDLVLERPLRESTSGPIRERLT